MSTSALLILPMLAPLAVLGLLLVPATRALGRTLAPFAALPALLIALFATDSALALPWLLLDTRFVLDATGRDFLLFTAFVWLICGWYARGYLHADARIERFWLFFLSAQAGNLGLCIAADAASFYLLFALMSFAAYGLVVHKGGEAAWRAGRIYLVMAVIGEALLVVGVLAAVHAADGHRFAELQAGADLPGWAAALLLAGFGIKAGVPLLHMWLPLAHPVAPVPASAALSGVMLKAGLLGWIRFLPLGGAALPEAGQVLMSMALAAMFLGVLLGMLQSDIKVLLAYSSISQMGFVTLGVGAGLLAPALWPLLLPAVTLYALHHALAKSALFLGSGIVKTWPGNRLAVAALAIPAAALAGLSFTSGALVKSGLKYALADLPAPWPGLLDWMLPAAAVGTTLLMARFLWLASARSTEEDHRGMVAPWSLLLLAVLASTWWLTPPDAAAQALSAAGLLAATWPVALGLLLGWGLLHWKPPVATVPAGDLLLWLEQAWAGLTHAWRHAHPLGSRLTGTGTRLARQAAARMQGLSVSGVLVLIGALLLALNWGRLFQ